MPTCAQTVADTLKLQGVRRIFGVPGGETVDLVEACRQAGIEFVLTRHEAVAAFMADVTGQITGTPGVCVATLGPGATNLVSGVANACLDRSPLVAITAQVATASQPYVNHQFIDLERMFAPVCKRTFALSGRGSAGMIEEGFRVAASHPRGSVYFCLPSDVARREEEPLPAPPSAAPAAPDGEAPAQAASRLAEAIHRADRPLVVLGMGLDPARDVPAVRRFIRKNGFPVLTTPKGLGVFPSDDPLFLGTVFGLMADQTAVELVTKAPLVIGIGFDPMESDKLWHRDANIVSINNYSIRYRDYAPALEAVGVVADIMESLMAEDFSGHAWRRPELESMRQSLDRAIAPNAWPRPGTFSPYDIIDVTRRATPRDAILTTDVGAHKLLAGKIWPTHEPLTFFTSNGFSSMGYGLPAAMAAKLALPSRPVVCLTGDGGLAMVIQDLETAVRLGLPMAILVLCDRCLSLIEMVQGRRGVARCGVDLGPVDFVGVARGFGARGIRLNSLDELPRILGAAFDDKVPTVVEVPLDGSCYCRRA